jgi:hypothetical protein
MAENVSSNILFHFTKSMGDIKSILKHGFFPHYCPEYSLDPVDRKAARKGLPPMHAAPMVCFCDLPLSLISKHLKKYGSYGIGLSKKWGRKHGVAPVIYTHTKTQTRLLSRLATRAAKGNDESAANDLKILSAYTKPYFGPEWKDNGGKRRAMFYDEREWRYVPVLRGDVPLFLDWKDYDNDVERNRLHERFKQKNALPLPPYDIQYLIVPYDKDEHNILVLHDYLTELYSEKDAILVTTAIMTDNFQEDV